MMFNSVHEARKMGSLRRLYHQFEGKLQVLTEWKRPEHYKVLAWLMVGIFHSKDVRLDSIATDLPLEAKPESVGKRFRRWLKNDDIDERAIYDPVIRGLLARLRYPRLRIQIDRVMIKRRFNVLVVSVYYHKRAIPLVWKVLPHNGNSCEWDWREVFAVLEEVLPVRTSVMILGDREFGTVGMMRWLDRKGWDYCLRVRESQFIYMPRVGRDRGHVGEWITLGEVAPEPGSQYFLTDVLYTKGALYPVHFALACDQDSDDPWYIATNRTPSRQTLKDYGRRFGCEELFSDMKKRGFNWEDTLLRHAHRLSRLLLAIALLTIWMLALGRQACVSGAINELVCRSHRRRYSQFQLGRRWLKRRIHLDKPFDLFGKLPFWQLA
jgi:hypothetical protein